MPNPYQVALSLLSKIKKQINIIVVGANDGKFNDPIYDFVMKSIDRTAVCLIEPNTRLKCYLKENYSGHPKSKIINCAIGPNGVLTLYAIKEKYWSDFQPSYATNRGWPEYRAATGITSASREHLEDALKDHSNINAAEAITSLTVPSKELDRVLQDIDWKMPIDVLQIDTEGYDDSVIYSSNLKLTKPKYIYFELCHIPKDRLDVLVNYLSREGYKTYKIQRNALSVKTKGSFLCRFLGSFLFIYFLFVTKKSNKRPKTSK